MSDRLPAARMDAHLAASRKTAAWREGRGLAKSNKIDADLLAELWDEKPVIKYGVRKRWWEVWLAPQEVGHDGRTTLQWAWIEAAHGAVRKDARLRCTFNRHTSNGKENRNRGYIKVASRMCCIGHAMWKKKTDYQEVPPGRPGSGQKKRLSRPGTGQPCRPMVTGPR